MDSTYSKKSEEEERKQTTVCSIKKWVAANSRKTIIKQGSRWKNKKNKMKNGE